MPNRLGVVRVVLCRAVVLAMVVFTPALAQKVPGETIPTAPAPARRAAPAAPSVMRAPPPAAAAPQAGVEGDAEARQLAAQLPLDPATANLQGRMPADVPGTISRLGLHVPNGPRRDLRNRSATVPEVIDALRH